MKNGTDKKIGALLIIASAMIYTIERCAAIISYAIEQAGYASHGTGNDFQPDIPGFFDNVFVPFLLLVGFIVLVYGFFKK